MTKLNLLIMGLILFLLILTGSMTNSVLAQEKIEESGEVVGGKSDSIPIQLKVGEMVQGEFIAVRNQRLRLSIADFTGKPIHYFGETTTRGGFYYAAKEDGQHYLVVTNPDAFSVGTRGYRLVFEIMPTDLSPGTGSGKNTSKDMTKPSITMTTVWWIVGGVFLFLILLGALFGSRQDEEYDYIFFVLRIRRRR